MKNKYFNSIIVCAFNEEENIFHCLSSIEKAVQKIINYEVLVINNGSSDNTSLKIKDFSNNSSKIALLYSVSLEATNVLIENQSQSNPEYYFGRSVFLQPVYVKAKNLDVGDIVPIGIETCNHKSLYGTIIH